MTEQGSGRRVRVPVVGEAMGGARVRPVPAVGWAGLRGAFHAGVR
jgi:hypothetical protein